MGGNPQSSMPPNLKTVPKAGPATAIKARKKKEGEAAARKERKVKKRARGVFHLSIRKKKKRTRKTPTKEVEARGGTKKTLGDAVKSH